MRADRLVATLLVLQARRRVTAAQLAAELEVSERTARRDLEALAAAGVPVYSQSGRGGGWSLVGGARTDLSGLTGPEARALFLLAGPSAHATPPLKAALRKLVQALPVTFRAEAEAAAAAVVIDPSSWDRTEPPQPEHLEILQQAVVDGVQARIAYAGPRRPESERVVHPLGLVIKGSVWYLVAGTADGMRTFRVGRVGSVTLTGDPVVRPDGFDLAEHWKTVVAGLDEQRAPVRVTALVDPHAIGWLRHSLGSRARLGAERDDGRFDVELRVHSEDSGAAELAGYGDAIEVLGPPGVCEHLARIGAGLTARYGS